MQKQMALDLDMAQVPILQCLRPLYRKNGKWIDVKIRQDFIIFVDLETWNLAVCDGAEDAIVFHGVYL